MRLEQDTAENRQATSLPWRACWQTGGSRNKHINGLMDECDHKVKQGKGGRGGPCSQRPLNEEKTPVRQRAAGTPPECSPHPVLSASPQVCLLKVVFTGQAKRPGEAWREDMCHQRTGRQEASSQPCETHTPPGVLVLLP